MTERRYNRRRVLAGLGAAGLSGLAGCGGFTGDESEQTGTGGTASGTAGGTEDAFGEFRGSGPLAEGRGDVGGTAIADLPDLSGELTIYLGGGEGGLYRDRWARFE